jgi:uncharacterized membrane protein YcgQ (UPF0703/DUF1980 family)
MIGILTMLVANWKLVAGVVGTASVFALLAAGAAYEHHQGYQAAEQHFETVEKPAIIKATQEADAATYEAAAVAAQKAAELAKFKAIEAVTQQAQQQQALEDAANQAAIDELNKENADYEQQLRARGRSYVFDQSDVDYLNGVRSKP